MEPITSWIEMFLCAGSTILFIAKYSGSHQWWTPPLMFCSDFDEVFQKIFFAELFCNYDLYKIDFETSFGTGFRNSHYCLGQGVYSLQSNNFSSSTVTGSKKARGRRKRISPPPLPVAEGHQELNHDCRERWTLWGHCWNSNQTSIIPKPCLLTKAALRLFYFRSME